MLRVRPRSSGGQCQRAFHPSHDGDLTPEFLVHDLNPFDPIVHAAAAQRVRDAEGLQARLVEQGGAFLANGRALVLIPVDASLPRNVDHLARRVGTRQQAIDAKVVHQLALRGGHLAPIAGVVDEGNAQMPGGKHHDHRLDGKVVNGLARDQRADSSKRTHGKPPNRILGQLANQTSMSNLIAKAWQHGSLAIPPRIRAMFAVVSDRLTSVHKIHERFEEPVLGAGKVPKIG